MRLAIAAKCLKEVIVLGKCVRLSRILNQYFSMEQLICLLSLSCVALKCGPRILDAGIFQTQQEVDNKLRVVVVAQGSHIYFRSSAVSVLFEEVIPRLHEFLRQGSFAYLFRCMCRIEIFRK